jgi:SAM-dependent methyltransferase
MAATRPYRWLAEHYDQMFGSLRAPIDDARQHVLGRILPHVKTACDLACGTGTTALSFALRGIKTFAVDVSPGMCRAARDKARIAGARMKVIRADMRDFRLPEPVDLVTCECDAVNHIACKTDLAAVASSVARCLRPGGYFYFDVNHRRGFQRYWNATSYFEQDGVVLVMRNGNDAGHDRAWSDVEWFVREGSLWRRHSERVEEVCWSPDEIRQTLTHSGFSSLRSWDALRFFRGNLLMGRGCRAVCLARKASAPASD